MTYDAGPDDLAEGAMRTVEMDGSTVLVARVDGVYHAIVDACPHAGGPLHQGVLHGHTVICPWHKAAFDVRTGRRCEPPAVDDQPWYEVVAAAGRLSLSGPITGTVTPGRGETRTVLIVGAGAAGVAAAQTLREEGFGGRVVMIGEEDRLPYDRTIQSKYVLSGKKGGEKTPLHEAEFYDRHRIERVVGTVTALDPAARRAEMSDGTVFEFDAALLATGGTPKRPSIPGMDRPEVFLLRSAADAEAIVAAAKPARRAVVLGAGFIAMEAAASLRERGLEVTVVAPQSAPFEKQLGAEVGNAFRRLHERAGVEFRLGDEAAGIEPGEVRLKSGTAVAADLVVVGMGITPATGMLRGVEVRKDGGVDVDAGMRAADGVWAAGDVAAFPLWGDGERVRVEHWRVAMQHGRVAALNMLGRGARFDAAPYFWTIHFMKRLDYVGHAPDWDELVIDGDLQVPEFAAFYVRSGTVAAVAGWGRDEAMARAIPLLAERRDWTVEALKAALRVVG